MLTSLPMAALRWTSLLVALVGLNGSTCSQSKDTEHGEAATTSGTTSSASGRKITLEGVDTSQLTAREHVIWSEHVSQLLAPCPEVAVSIAQCVQEKRRCEACTPAASFLLRQVRGGKSKSEVAELFAARFDPKLVKTLVIGDSPALGPAGAAVTIVEFADFECGACAQMSPFLDLLISQFPGDLRVVYKQYPLQGHPHAKLAAQAAVAAHRQGKFWKMHHTIFENQHALTEADLMGYAKQLDLDVAKFRRDLLSDATLAQVDKEYKQGEGLGVNATPTLFINGRKLPLGQLADPLIELEHWIRLEITLAKSGRGAPAGSAAASAAPAASGSAAQPAVSASAAAAPPPTAVPTAAPGP